MLDFAEWYNSGMETPPSPQKPEPVGPPVAIVLVVLVFLIGGVYFFLSQQDKWRPSPPLESVPQA